MYIYSRAAEQDDNLVMLGWVESNIDRNINPCFQKHLSMFSYISNIQDKSTTGKQGLGIKDRPKKIAGVRFHGKKTSFDVSDDEESVEEASGDFTPSTKRKCDESPNVEKIGEPKVKLKKLCKKLLRQVCHQTLMSVKFVRGKILIDCISQVPGESLKLKQLKVLIDEHSTLVLSNFSSKKDAVAYLKEKVLITNTTD